MEGSSLQHSEIPSPVATPEEGSVKSPPTSAAPKKSPRSEQLEALAAITNSKTFREELGSAGGNEPALLALNQLLHSDDDAIKLSMLSVF